MSPKIAPNPAFPSRLRFDMASLTESLGLSTRQATPTRAKSNATVRENTAKKIILKCEEMVVEDTPCGASGGRFTRSAIGSTTIVTRVVVIANWSVRAYLGQHHFGFSDLASGSETANHESLTLTIVVGSDGLRKIALHRARVWLESSAARAATAAALNCMTVPHMCCTPHVRRRGVSTQCSPNTSNILQRNDPDCQATECILMPNRFINARIITDSKILLTRKSDISDI